MGPNKSRAEEDNTPEPSYPSDDDEYRKINEDLSKNMKLRLKTHFQSQRKAERKRVKRRKKKKMVRRKIL